MSKIIKNNNPLVSVIMSSHNEADMVQTTLNKFFDRATNPDEIEIILRIDDEAERSQDWINSIRLCAGVERQMQITIISGPREYGYCSIPDNQKECAAVSKGEFIFGACDDIDDIDQGWDDNIRKWKGKCVLLTNIAEENTHLWDFWAFHRKIFELTETIAIVEYSNYHYPIYDKHTPQLVKNAGFKLWHQPTANFGLSSAQGQHCARIEDPNYKLNKDPYFENQEGDKWEHFAKHYVSKVIDFVKNNPEYDPNLEEIVNEDIS